MYFRHENLLFILQESLMKTRFSLGLPGQFMGFLVIPKLAHPLDRPVDKGELTKQEQAQSQIISYSLGEEP